VEQATRAYEIAELRYREGVSTQLELSDARLLLAQAQVNRAQAARDLQVARARLALLPDLPLSAAPLPSLASTPATSSPGSAAPASVATPANTRPAGLPAGATQVVRGGTGGM
jgi:outer membrane protein TolC